MNDAFNAIYKNINANELQSLYNKIKTNDFNDNEKINYICENVNGTFTAIDNNLGTFEQDTFLTKNSAIQFLAYPLRREHLHETDLMEFQEILDKERTRNMEEKYPHLKKYLNEESYNKIVNGITESNKKNEKYVSNILNYLDNTLRLYYETDDLYEDETEKLVSKEDNEFDLDTIMLSENLIELSDYLQDKDIPDIDKQKEDTLKEISDFVKEEDRTIPWTFEKNYKLPDGNYFHFHLTDEGYYYSVYNKEFLEINGGLMEYDPEINEDKQTIKEIRERLSAFSGYDITSPSLEEIDNDTFSEKTYEAEMKNFGNNEDEEGEER